MATPAQAGLHQPRPRHERPNGTPFHETADGTLERGEFRRARRRMRVSPCSFRSWRASGPARPTDGLPRPTCGPSAWPVWSTRCWDFWLPSLLRKLGISSGNEEAAMVLRHRPGHATRSTPASNRAGRHVYSSPAWCACSLPLTSRLATTFGDHGPPLAWGPPGPSLSHPTGERPGCSRDTCRPSAAYLRISSALSADAQLSITAPPPAPRSSSSARHAVVGHSIADGCQARRRFPLEPTGVPPGARRFRRGLSLTPVPPPAC